MSLIQAPLNILKDVHFVMHSEFSELDIQQLYRVVDMGALVSLGDSVGKYDISEPLPRTARDADDTALARYNSLVKPLLPRLSVMLQVIAPFMMRYSKLVDAVHEYLERQIRQTKMLTTVLMTCWIAVLTLSVISVYSMYSKLPTRQKQAYSVSVTVIITTLVYGVVMMWNMMLTKRMKGLQDVDLSVIDKYDRMLGYNVYMQYADAYSRGAHDSFARDYARKTREREEEQEGDPVFDACADEDRPRAFKEVRDCVINPCDPPTLEEALQLTVKETWATREDLSPCGRVMLMLLEGLASVHDGSVFDSKDRNAMWNKMRDRVDDLRALALRRLDVDSSKGRDGQVRIPSNLDVVKDKILPAMKLEVVETADLFPILDVSLFNSDALYTVANKSITTKLQCWRMCRDDPHCAWAFFHPAMGGIFCKTDCDGTGSGSGSGCLSTRVAGLMHVTADSGDADSRGWTTLVKRSPKDTDHVWVCRKGITRAARRAWTAIPGMQKAGDPGSKACGEVDMCRAFSSRVPKRGGSTEADVSFWTEASVHGSGGRRHGRGGGEGGGTRALPFAAIFDIGQGAMVSSLHTAFAVKVSTESLYRAMLERYAVSTFYNLVDVVVDDVVDILKKHTTPLDINKYTDYVHSELEAFYGPDTYDTLKPIVGDLFVRVVTRLEKLFTKGGRLDALMYVPAVRFEEKMDDLTFSEAKSLALKTGELAKVTQLYMSSFPGYSVNVGDELLKLVCTTFVMMLLVGIVGFNAKRGMCYRAGECEGWSFVRGLLLTVSAFVLLVVVMASVIMRFSARSSFNSDVSQGNGRQLVNSTSRVMQMFVVLFESIAHKRIAAHAALSTDLNTNIAELLKSFGYESRAKQILEGADLQTQGPDKVALYRHVRRVIDAYDRCNTLSAPRRLPFPTYELIVYSIVIVVIVTILGFVYYTTDPGGKIRNIGRLTTLRDNIKAGLPPPEDFREIVRCCESSGATWTVIMNLCVVLLVMLNFFLVPTILSSSRTYEMGLYASALYKEGRCVP